MNTQSMANRVKKTKLTASKVVKNVAQVFEKKNDLSRLEISLFERMIEFAR